MSRSERFTSEKEIKKYFVNLDKNSAGANPVLFMKNGVKYGYDGDGHYKVEGNTGRGKSQCVVMNTVREILQKGESAVIVDPKEEIYRNTAGSVPEIYQKFCINFRDVIESPTKWNMMRLIHNLYKSKDLRDNSIADELINDMGRAFFGGWGDKDKFWSDAASNLFIRAVYTLLETAPAENMNIDSVLSIVENVESKALPPFLGKNFYDMLPDDSFAKRKLVKYVTGPLETRASIQTSALNGLASVSKNRLVTEMLCHDNLSLISLDTTKPFIVYIILPDETDSYNVMAGLLVRQLLRYLNKRAYEYGGRLPIRVNFILEEMGTVGKGIPNLPSIVAMGRSKNIRVMLVLQNTSQLERVYGKAAADNIDSCMAVTIGFSTNSFNTLTKWSNICGEVYNVSGGALIREPLVTAAQLGAMPAGTALIMVKGQYKFITNLPFYYKIYGESCNEKPEFNVKAKTQVTTTLNFTEFARDMKRRKMEREMAEIRRKEEEKRGRLNLPTFEDLLKMTDEEIEEVGNAFDGTTKTENKTRKYDIVYSVLILDLGPKKADVIRAIAQAKRAPVASAENECRIMPVELWFAHKKDREKFMEKIVKNGAVAIMTEEENDFDDDDLL